MPKCDAIYQQYHPLTHTTGKKGETPDRLVIALNVPFDVPTDALVKLGGDGANTGKYYAYAAQAAIDDINR